MIFIQPRPVDPRISVRTLDPLTVEAVVPFHRNQVIFVILPLKYRIPLVVQNQSSAGIEFLPDQPILLVKHLSQLVISRVPRNGSPEGSVGAFPDRIPLLVKLPADLDKRIPRHGGFSPWIVVFLACHVLRILVFLNDPVILCLLARRRKSGPVQVPFFGNVPGVIIFPLDHRHAIHVLGQPGVLPVLDLDHLVFLVVHPLGLVVPGIPADRPPIRVEGLLADGIPVPVKLPLDFCIRIRRYACLARGIKPGLAEHMLRVQIGLVYPVGLHAAVDDRLSFRVKVSRLQGVPLVVVLSGEILISGRQRYRFAVHTEVCFLAQRAEAVVFPLNLCVSRCQRHRLPIHAVVAFLRHLARTVVLSLNDGISGLQGHQLPVDPVVFNDGAFHTLLSLFLIISIGGGFDGFPLFVCVDFLNFFRYFKFLVFLVFFRYFFLCYLFLAFFSLSDPFLVFSFILAHCAQVLHQHRPLIRVFLPRCEHQLAVCVVVLHAHDAALAVVLGLNNGIPVFPGGHPVPCSEQGFLRHLPSPVVFHPDLVYAVRPLVRVPVCLPVALAGLVLPFPGVPDFLHAAGSRAGVSLRVVPVRANNVFFFIPLIRHPGIPVLDVDRRLPVRVVVVAFH